MNWAGLRGLAFLFYEPLFTVGTAQRLKICHSKTYEMQPDETLALLTNHFRNRSEGLATRTIYRKRLNASLPPSRAETPLPCRSS